MKKKGKGLKDRLKPLFWNLDGRHMCYTIRPDAAARGLCGLFKRVAEVPCVTVAEPAEGLYISPVKESQRL